MIHGTLIPSHFEEYDKGTARYSSAGEKVAREFNPRGLAASNGSKERERP
jgi:hypothetical protein